MLTIFFTLAFLYALAAWRLCRNAKQQDGRFTQSLPRFEGKPATFQGPAAKGFQRVSS